MPTGSTSVSVVNEALQRVATQVQITALTDTTTAAKAASVVYQPIVGLLLRVLDPDFARTTIQLQAAGVVNPVAPWGYEYLYPATCLRLRQVRPAIGAYDPNDPQPVRANVAVDTIGGTLTKVILTNQANALAVCTTSAVSEALWDEAFMEAVVQRLGNPLAMALSGRPDFARELLDEAGRSADLADAVDEGGFRRVMV
jgi:hypothetical protein